MACVARPYGSSFEGKFVDAMRNRLSPRTECRIFDAGKKSLGTISPHPVNGLTGNVNCLTMHKMRFFFFLIFHFSFRGILAVADDRAVTVYGPK